MTLNTVRIASIALLATGVSAAAHAEYRCNPAPTWADRASCEAAAQGPTELRRQVQAMNTLRINQRFEHYVNDATLARWAQADTDTKFAARKQEEPVKVASTTR